MSTLLQFQQGSSAGPLKQGREKKGKEQARMNLIKWCEALLSVRHHIQGWLEVKLHLEGGEAPSPGTIQRLLHKLNFKLCWRQCLSFFSFFFSLVCFQFNFSGRRENEKGRPLTVKTAWCLLLTDPASHCFPPSLPSINLCTVFAKMPATSLPRFDGVSQIIIFFAFKQSYSFLIQNTPQLLTARLKTGALWPWTGSDTLAPWNSYLYSALQFTLDLLWEKRSWWFLTHPFQCWRLKGKRRNCIWFWKAPEGVIAGDSALTAHTETRAVQPFCR